ncbi:acyltransferase family protein [Levilactobacillus brevis]|uniref:acyltransferase family protein n=1 Tax=Levilactobacillus TaxID=2767886 RepID=UPI00225E3FAA|nr:acyltransferase [Levilactobacillus brevis]MCX7511738.1 acyltransferase [Levilactobacillus brevis]
MEKHSNIYDGVNGLKVFGCFAIIIMHNLVNANIRLNPIANMVIRSWTNLVFLFFIVSAFGLCCGYYERFHSGKVNLEYFYRRRYGKIVPFFFFLLLIAFLIQHTKENIFEELMESTLLFGFLPNNHLQTMGISWTLGVIFAFYLIFPFFTVVVSNKIRIWSALVISLIIDGLCDVYFFTNKFVSGNFVAKYTFIYCFPFFIIGGLIYIYRDIIIEYVQKYWLISLFLVGLVIVSYFILPNSFAGISVFNIKQVLMNATLSILAIGSSGKNFKGKVIKYFSGISMEMYLAQMVVFDLLLRLGIDKWFGDSWLSLITLTIIEILSLVIFIEGYKRCFEKILLFLRSFKYRY